jgi:hypothetical protein
MKRLCIHNSSVCRRSLAVLSGVWVVGLSLPAFGSIGDEPRIQNLSGLVNPAAWDATASDESVSSHDGLPGWLRVGFRCEEGNTGSLLLKKPVTLPAWVNGMSFLATNNGPLASLRIAAIIRDSQGREYVYYAIPRPSYSRGLFYPEHPENRLREMRFSVPGLSRPKLEPQAGATIAAAGGHRVDPVPPLQFVGLNFEGGHQLEQEQRTPQFFFRDFALTGLSPGNTRLYYQFMGEELYGEVVPRPYLTPGQFGTWWGRRFDISWEVYADYAGQPVLTGSKSFVFEPDDPDRPMAVQLAEHMEIPVTTPGTWWVRTKLRRWEQDNGPAPDSISEHEYRLYVHKSEDSTRMEPIPGDAEVPGSFVRIAPARASVIFAADEPFVVPVRFQEPAEELPNATCRVEVRRGPGGDLVKEMTVVPQWTEGRFVLTCDLSDQPPGAYEVTGSLLTHGKPFDRGTRLIGRQEPEPESSVAVDREVLESVPSWRRILDREQPLFDLTPVLPDNDGSRHNRQSAWEQHYKPFLDHAAELSREISLPVPWKDVEPLPGVYDWRAVDRFLDYAGRKRLQVILNPEYRAGSVPEWIASAYEENPDGKLFGHGSYLFHGARPNMFHAEAFRKPLMAFIAAMTERYRNHPALLGYYTCLEHPGDASYKGWYEGYSPESRKAWIEYAKENWQTLETVNQRWQTHFATWEAVDHPDRENASKRFLLDWLLFRTRSIEGFLKEIVATIRERDQHRLIIVYGDGVNDLAWFRDRGCISANGGSHDVMQWGIYAQHGLQNYPMRTEDHSPGNWSGYFPTQMDASVFAMMAGGGVNAHARAFVRTNISWEEYTNPDTGRGRYKRFQPTWRELRQTTAQPIETFVYNTMESYLAYSKTTFKGAYNAPWQVLNLQAAQVPFSYGPHELWSKGKLLVLTNQRTALEESALREITDYATNGGTVFMQADYGRHNVDNPDEEWALLKRFGFTPPADAVQKDRMLRATPVPKELFSPQAQSFVLRDAWKVPVRHDMQTAATFDKEQKQAAISWKSFGKGKVAVMWAQTTVPPMNARGSYPFLRDVATWAGVELYSKASTDLLWTNFLIGKDGRTFYGLAHVGSWQNSPAKGVDTTVRWLVLPEGDYHVTELISGKEVGDFTAARLKSEGLPVKLGTREVAIFRMARK